MDSKKKKTISAHWQIDLIKIGRGKKTETLTCNPSTLPQVEQIALRRCKRYLASRDVGLMHISDLRYSVLAGGRTIGIV